MTCDAFDVTASRSQACGTPEMCTKDASEQIRTVVAPVDSRLSLISGAFAFFLLFSRLFVSRFAAQRSFNWLHRISSSSSCLFSLDAHSKGEKKSGG